MAVVLHAAVLVPACAIVAIVAGNGSRWEERVQALQVEQRVVMATVAGRRHHLAVVVHRGAMVITHHARRVHVIFGVGQVADIRSIPFF